MELVRAVLRSCLTFYTLRRLFDKRGGGENCMHASMLDGTHTKIVRAGKSGMWNLSSELMGDENDFVRIYFGQVEQSSGLAISFDC